MNRQQRRLLRQEKQVEAKHLSRLYDRQNRVDDNRLQLFFVAIALAHHNLWPNNDDRIEPLLSEWNKTICRITNEGITLAELTEEVRKKTGFWFQFSEDSISMMEPTDGR